MRYRGLGVGIVTYNRPECLERCLASIYSSGLRVPVVVMHTGASYGDPSITERCMTEDGLLVRHHFVRNLLPWARHVAETELSQLGCRRFLITDDDVMLDGRKVALMARLSSRELPTIFGGGLRTSWRSPGMASDLSYLAWLGSDDPVPGGRTVPVGSVYSMLDRGLWSDVVELGIKFTCEDLAWCYLAHKRGATFKRLGFVGLHAPPTEPSGYPEAPNVWQSFLEACRKYGAPYA